MRPKFSCGIDGCQIMGGHRHPESVAVIIQKLRELRLLEVAFSAAHAHDVTLEQMFGDSRMRPRSAARHDFWARLYATGSWSYAAIAELCGVDHTSAMNGIVQANRRGHVPAVGVYGMACA